MVVTRVTVFDAYSDNNFDSAIEEGLTRARRMIGNSRIELEDFSVRDRKRVQSDDGTERFHVTLNVSFGYTR